MFGMFSDSRNLGTGDSSCGRHMRVKKKCTSPVRGLLRTRVPHHPPTVQSRSTLLWCVRVYVCVCCVCICVCVLCVFVCVFVCAYVCECVCLLSSSNVRARLPQKRVSALWMNPLGTELSLTRGDNLVYTQGPFVKRRHFHLFSSENDVDSP